ncbi:hypothetical protein SFOMI_2756 [Sphingobium fuliginis]|uniref:DUF4328 domain-containing protein n=2 Tax=Sphingobium fuliginis (strain ATCC 27551) TaxID=336203 RepID=A0A292ZH10_SPHSA|nr:hypothetical protein SFOMI_2756 [Sphingobium fuliginis]
MYMAGFIPPTPPTMSLTDLVALYSQNATAIRVVAIAMLFLLSGLMLLYSALGDQLWEIEGGSARTCSRIQVTLGGISLVPVYGTAACWALAAYRSERAPEITQMLSDLGWYLFVFPVAPALFQMWAIGFAVLSDKSARPKFPRWYGFLCFWVGILLMTGLFVPFFKVGPFAWNGLLAFWVAAITLGIWINITGALVLGVAKQGRA